MSEKTELAMTLESSPAQQTFALLSRAIESGTSPEALEKLVALQERILDRNAEQAYAAAMVEVQRRIKPVYRNSKSPQTNSRYAKLEKMHSEISPIYTEAGFCLSFGEGDSPHADMRRILCDVMHRDGHSRQYHMDLPLDDKGIKGMINKTGIHAMGSTMSYGRRYLEAQIFGVVFTDEDDDGSLGGVESITPEQAMQLKKLSEDVGADKNAFLAYMKAASFEKIPARDHGRAVSALRQKQNKSR